MKVLSINPSASIAIREMALNLERSGHAYPCFCTQEELQAKRAKAEAERRAWKYDGTCRALTQADRERLRAEGRPAAVRFRVPDSGQTSFEDQVFGHIEVDHRDLEDFVLLRSDGHPTYHLGVVADDLDLRITHVIRGADHISNTPKQILMYQALEAPRAGLCAPAADSRTGQTTPVETARGDLGGRLSRARSSAGSIGQFSGVARLDASRPKGNCADRGDDSRF